MGAGKEARAGVLVGSDERGETQGPSTSLASLRSARFGRDDRGFLTLRSARFGRDNT